MMALVEDETEVLPITMERFLKKQSSDNFCKRLPTVAYTTSLFDIE